MKNVLFMFVLFLFVVALVVWLQIFLSKMKNKWLGLILPILSFIYSLIMVSGIVVFETMGKGQILMSVISTFLVSNIPTIVLLTLYFGIRERMKIRSEIDKMNIKDL